MPHRLRAVVLWLGVTLTCLGVTAASAPEVAALLQAPGTTFNRLLVQCCAAAALVATVMLWLATCEVVCSVLRSPEDAVRRRTGPVRSALLAACGLIVLASASTTGAAAGTDATGATDRALAPESLSGLPLPDRAEGGAGDPPGRRREGVVRVVDGDSLWTISVAQLGPGASDAQIAAHGRRLYALNAATIGADPDLIVPGLVLELPQH